MGKRQPSHSATRDSSYTSLFSIFRTSPALLPAVFITAIAIGAFCLWHLCHSEPDIPFLEKTGSSDWIIYPKPPSGQGHFTVPLTTVFRRSWQIDRLPTNALLSCKTFRTGWIHINGRELEGGDVQQKLWKRGFSRDIAKFLKAGENEISVVVSNSSGPPAIWLTIEAGDFPVRTDSQWRCSLMGATWKNAVLASATPAIRPGNPLYDRASIGDTMRGGWHAALVILLLSAGFVWAANVIRRSREQFVRFFVSYQNLLIPGAVILAWIALMFNNLPQLPVALGFDQAGHLEYVRYILQNKSLPLANDGWQMYQPPLYYLLSAAIIGPLARSFSADTCILVLRSFSALVGMLHLSLIYLGLRRLFPNRAPLQAAALVFCALLPANLCISHYVTNEPLAALFVTGSFYFALRAGNGSRPRTLIVLAAGFSLGLALLTKFSALLAIPFVLAVIILSEFLSPQEPAAHPTGLLRLRSTIVFLVGMIAVCGWHYARVWHHFGKPLVGNWDPIVARLWWQEPGYRTVAWYAHFGDSLKRPLFSAFASFWDGVYSTLWGDGLCSGSGDTHLSPPWNYDLMNLGYLFAFPLAGLLAIGCVALCARANRVKGRNCRLLCGYLIAMAFGLTFMTLRVASYAQGKAFYALPALLPLSIVAATGWEFISSRGRLLQMACQSLLLAWAITVYGSFWIQRLDANTWLTRGAGWASQGKYSDAVDAFSQALKLKPDSPHAQAALADALDRSGRRDEGRRHAMEATTRWPNDPDVQVQAANSLMADGRFAEAADLLRRAISTAPDHPTACESLGACLFEMKDYANAITALQEAARVNPFNPQTHYGLAAAFSQAGDPTNAAIHLQFSNDLSHH